MLEPVGIDHVPGNLPRESFETLGSGGASKSLYGNVESLGIWSELRGVLAHSIIVELTIGISEGKRLAKLTKHHSLFGHYFAIHFGKERKHVQTGSQVRRKPRMKSKADGSSSIVSDGETLEEQNARDEDLARNATGDFHHPIEPERAKCLPLVTESLEVQHGSMIAQFPARHATDADTSLAVSISDDAADPGDTL